MSDYSTRGVLNMGSLPNKLTVHFVFARDAASTAITLTPRTAAVKLPYAAWPVLSRKA